MERDPLTERIIGCAIRVHRHFGPGLLEAPYRSAMCLELAAQGIAFEREPSYPLVYRGVKISDFRPDLIVERAVVVEIKSVDRYDPVFTAQILTYIRITGTRIGLLINFNRPVLKDGIKRFVL